MAAGPKLDGAGIQKMKTIEEAVLALQKLHGVVEQYALALKNNKPATMYSQQVKRTLSPLVGLLKGQFGMIADQAAALNLVATRGGSETVKIRMLREGVGSLRQQLDIAIVKIKELHAVKEEVVEGARKPGE
jgi:type I site-specific restriction endonuclease